MTVLESACQEDSKTCLFHAPFDEVLAEISKVKDNGYHFKNWWFQGYTFPDCYLSWFISGILVMEDLEIYRKACLKGEKLSESFLEWHLHLA